MHKKRKQIYREERKKEKKKMSSMKDDEKSWSVKSRGGEWGQKVKNFCSQEQERDGIVEETVIRVGKR